VAGQIKPQGLDYQLIAVTQVRAEQTQVLGLCLTTFRASPTAIELTPQKTTGNPKVDSLPQAMKDEFRYELVTKW